MANTRRTITDLDRLAAELGREHGRERLSPGARRRIYDAVASDAEPTPLGSLFFPIRKLALAGIVPAMVLGLLLAGAIQRPAGTPAVDSPASVQVAKIGNEIVFHIANGKAVHRVYRSASPESFVTAPTRVEDRGVYRDRLVSGADIVFYRID